MWLGSARDRLAVPRDAALRNATGRPGAPASAGKRLGSLRYLLDRGGPGRARWGGMTTARMVSLAGLLTLPLLSGGCFLLPEDHDTQFVQADDVRLELPGMGAVESRGLDEFKINGDVHDLVLVTSDRVNTWVTEIVEVSARVVEVLDGVPETSREGKVRVYGPYEDRDGRDLAWLVKIGEDDAGTVFEMFIGPRAAKGQEDMDRLMGGSLVIGEGTRSGGFDMDFDVVEKYKEIKGSRGALYTYSGALTVTFEREIESDKKHIDIEFDGLTAQYDGFLDSDTFYSDDTYTYHREGDGSGTFHLSLLGDWDDFNWSGPMQEEMTLKAAWTPAGEGRTRGTIVEVDGVGDMKHGDLQVDECFGSDSYLTWRQISEAYVVEVPDYNFGEEKSCVLDVAALDG